MLASAAFLLQLSLWLAGQDQRWAYALPFERADHNFYRAAQHGLSAQLTWPTGHRDQTGTVAAGRLVAELVHAARLRSRIACYTFKRACYTLQGHLPPSAPRTAITAQWDAPTGPPVLSSLQPGLVGA